MTRRRTTVLRVVAIAAVVLAIAAAAGTTGEAAAALPPGNTVAQWNQITEDTVLGVGMLADEGFIYMAYPSAAVYDAVVAIEGGFEPYGPGITAPEGASVDAAVVEAAYRTLWAYFAPGSCNPASPTYAFCLGVRPRLDAFYAEALSAIPPGQAKTDGQAVGLQAANDIIALRSGDGRMTPFGVTSPFPTLPPGPGVWRLTPPFVAPRTPWVGNVRRFILGSVDQFLPDPPPSLQSDEWAEAFNQIKAYGALTGSARTDEQTRIGQFWSASVIRQYNRVGRDLTGAGPNLLRAARLLAMVNLAGADALMSNLYAKYYYLFWRPVTAINGSLDPTAVTNDGFGPVPGYDDGNPVTVEQSGWRPLLPTPNHPEYPAAHGAITSAMAEVFSTFLGTNQIDLDIHGFDPAGPAGNLNAVRHFDMPNALRQEIIEGRLWAGLHYGFSSHAGVVLGRNVASYDLRHAFRPVS
jgi:VCPO second helical-bundle domain